MTHSVRKRLISAVLLIALTVSLLSGMTVSAATGTLTANSGVRDTVCTALSSQAQAYYTGSNSYASLSQLSGVNSTDSYTATQNNPLYTALYNLMSSTHTNNKVDYSGTGETSLAHYWGYTDAEAGSSSYLYFYTDVLADDSSVSSLTMNREHVWPQSKASYYQLNGGADLHHLRPSISGVNQSKSNNAFANLIGTGTTYRSYQVNNEDVIWTGTKDFDNVLEVRDNIKGDVARILLYVYCRWQQPNLYSDVASTNLPALDRDDDSNSGDRIIEDRATLLQWCQQDPVDEWEMQRNDQIENVQGNRNVFIDYPEFAWLMFGLTPPTDMVTPSGEAAGGSSTVTITANSNNTAWGTVSVSGSTITASPAEGYYPSGYEVTSGSATVTQSGNSFTVSATGNCTIKIIFSAKTPVTVSFSVPEGVTQAAVSGYADEAITLPTPTGTPSATAQSYTFAGWVTASLEDTTTKPTILKAGDSFSTSTNTTLYALYTYTTGGSGTTEYRLVTDADQLIAGSSVVIAAAGYDYALSTTQNGNNRGQAVIVKNTTDNTVAFASDAGVAELTLGAGTADRTWSFYDNSNSGYLYAASSSSNYLRTESALSDNSSYAVTVSSDGTATLAAQGTNTRNYVRYNNSSKIFSCYASTTTTVQPVALYIATAAGTVYYTTVLESACDHVYTDVVTPATCTADGYTTHTCSLCGYVYVDSTVPATGHSYDEGVITTAASCEEAGVKTFTCANCGDTYTEAIPSTGHNYVDGVCTNCGAAQGASNTYRLITAESDLASGNYVLIVNAGGKNPGSYSYYALKRQADGTYMLAEAADTYVGTSETMPTTISVSDDTIVWDAAYDTTMTLSDGSTNVLYTTKSNNLFYASGTASAWTLTFDSTTGTFKFQTTDDESKTRYLGLRDDLTSTGSNGNPRFRCNSTASTTSYQFYLYLQETASHTHSGTAVAAKDATCTEAGNKAYWTCTCGKLFADAACTTETTLEAVTIAATGHTPVTDAAVAPTCTTTGLTEGSHCSVCNTVLTAQTTIFALGHSYNSGVITTEPTCTTAGVKTFTCSRCSDSYTQSVDALGHTPVADPAIAATCTEAGLTEGSHCSVCNAVLTAQTTISALGHSYNSGVITTEPTCTTAGVKTFTCSRCSDSYTQSVDALGHTPVTDAAVEATCTATGLTEGSHCSVCNAVLTAQTEVPALGHNWGEGVVTLPAGEYTTGIMTFTCSRCGETKQESIPALGHTHQAVLTEATPATCTTAGNSGYYYCSGCGCYFSDAVCETQIAENSWIIPATGHTEVTDDAVAPTCTATGLTAGSHCSVCGVTIVAQTVVPAKGHTEVIDDAVAPTCTTTGLTAGSHCSACGEVIVAQTEVAALGHTYTYTDNGNGTHTVGCANCDYSAVEAHSFTNGTCVCSAVEGPIAAADLVFFNKSLVLKSYTAFNVICKYSVLEKYDSYYVVFERYDSSTGTADRVQTAGATSTVSAKYHSFEYPVMSYMMTDEITATLYAVKDGVTYVGETYTNSVRAYALSKIGTATEKMKSVYANLLNYGARAQEHLSYKTDDLATVGLDSYESYIVTGVPTTNNTSSITSDGYTELQLMTRALGLNAAVELQYVLKKNAGYAKEDLYAVYSFTRNGETIEGRIDGADFGLVSGYITIKVSALYATEGNAPVSLTVYSKADDSRLSETWTYSIESHVNLKVTGEPTTTQQKVLVALMNYYNAVSAAY